MIRVNRTDKVIGMGDTYEVLYDNSVKAYVVQEKYTHELSLHIPGVLNIKEARIILNYLESLDKNHKNYETNQYPGVRPKT